MAFTKAFYEQAFERNLKAQQQKPETMMASSGFAAASSATQTQRATMQFTAYSKKEVVRDFLFLFSFFFFALFVCLVWNAKKSKNVSAARKERREV
jgi:preprotein translocase subunit SecG